VKSAPNASRLVIPAAPGISAAPQSWTPQLRCKAVWRKRKLPPDATTRNSYQRRSSIGAGICTRPPPASSTAPSAATNSVSPSSIASTAWRRPSSSQGCTRTTIVHGSGSAIGWAAVTIPKEPDWIGWEREGYSPANAAATSSNLMPGPAGLASAWTIRTMSARYGVSNWLETLTATGSPGRPEKRST
jgi:hypothetical protein